MAAPKAHVSDRKKARVKFIADKLKSKTVMIVSVKGLPSAQFQDIKKKLRGKAHINVVKKNLLNFAIEHAGNKEIKALEEYNGDATALLFSDHDAFEISGILASNKSPAKAKAGDIAPADVEVKAGPTSLLPGPDISALSAVGLAPKVEDGKISVMQDKVIVKEGDTITEAHASIMAKLDIIPFEVGIDPIAAFMDGKIYADIKIDKEGFMEDMLAKFGRVMPFAVEIGYVCPETLDFVLGKAGMEGKAIEELIGKDKVEETKEEAPVEESNEEAVAEKAPEEGVPSDTQTGTSEAKVEEAKEEAVAEKESEGDTQEVKEERSVEEVEGKKEETNTEEAKVEESAEAASE
ncbi:50S ribosomal protein L10 [Candidatus Pacearchaeota archaeon]|nr:50S ribosomal protein L10 [Candidatus Pacearchaeota archaeon]|tara:strand:+ start:7180 stop:8229 length:1050 start_codon:yes stop_codon:yes gene_type:complete